MFGVKLNIVRPKIKKQKPIKKSAVSVELSGVENIPVEIRDSLQPARDNILRLIIDHLNNIRPYLNDPTLSQDNNKLKKLLEALNGRKNKH